MNSLVASLLEQPNTLEREQAARFASMRGQHIDQIKSRIEDVYDDKETKDGMREWADFATIVNPHSDIVRQIACAYKRGAFRLLEDATEAEEKAFDALLEEVALAGKDEEVNRIAYGVGPTAVVPVMRGQAMRLEVYRPDRWRPVFDPLDQDGPLEAAVFNFGQGRAAENPNAVTYAKVDREAWTYWDSQGKPADGPGGQHRIVHGARDAHGGALCPVAIARVDEPDIDDFWRHSRPQRMHVATIAGGVSLARLLQVRKYQDANLLLSRMPTDSTLEGGGVIGSPWAPVSIKGRTASAAALDVVEFALAPDDHLRMLNFLVSAAALGEGLPPETVTISAPLDVGRMPGVRIPQVAVSEGIKAQYQRQQIPFMRRFEQQLAVAMLAVARAGRHPLADKLPGPDEVRDRFLVEFAELDTIDDPDKRRDQDDWDLKHNIKSRVDLVRHRFPGLTRKKALDFILRNINEDAQIWQVLATRNQPATPVSTDLHDSPATPAEANGRLGPPTRDGENSNATT